MTYVPTNQFEFFEKVGPDFVEKAVVNGELKGKTLAGAKTWLERQTKKAETADRRRGLWLTLIGVLVAFSIGLATLVWRGGL